MPISSSLPGHGRIDTTGHIRWKTEGYGVSLEWEQYEPRAEKPKEIKGKVVISINDRILQYGNASKTLRWKLRSSSTRLAALRIGVNVARWKSTTGPRQRRLRGSIEGVASAPANPSAAAAGRNKKWPLGPLLDFELGTVLILDPIRRLSSTGPSLACGGVAVFRGYRASLTLLFLLGGRKDIVLCQAESLNQVLDFLHRACNFGLASGSNLLLKSFALRQQFLVRMCTHLKDILCKCLR